MTYFRLPRTSRRLVGLFVVGLLTAMAVARLWRPDPEAVYETALAAVEAERFEAAEAALSRLSRLRAPTVLDWGVRARVAIARGRHEEAIAALGKIPDDHPLAAWAHQRIGQLELRRRRFRRAESALRRALDLNPNAIEARRELIYILGVQLRRDDLNAQFQRLASQSLLTPKEAWVWCMSRELVWWASGEHSPILRDAIAADPDDRWSRLALAENLRRDGDPDGALVVLADLPRTDPAALAARARIALERGDPDTAAALLAESDDDHPALASLRGRLALALGDAPAAVRHLRRAFEAEPDRRPAVADLAGALRLAGQTEAAHSLSQRAARIDALHGLLLSAEERIGPVDPTCGRPSAVPAKKPTGCRKPAPGTPWSSPIARSTPRRRQPSSAWLWSRPRTSTPRRKPRKPDSS